MSNKKYVIVDLDNCIADDAWRIPRINWQKSNPMERYHDYHSLSGFDALGNRDIVDQHCVENIILTARPTLYRAITEEWLARNRVPYKYLIMRNNDDHQHSAALKRQMFYWLPALYNVAWTDIVAAYDDREDVIDMFCQHRIDAHVRCIHDVCAYTPPSTKTLTVTA